MKYILILLLALIPFGAFSQIQMPLLDTNFLPHTIYKSDSETCISFYIDTMPRRFFRECYYISSNIKNLQTLGFEMGWYENGKLKYLSEHKNGKWYGKYYEWYKNGNKKVKGEYMDSNDSTNKNVFKCFDTVDAPMPGGLTHKAIALMIFYGEAKINYWYYFNEQGQLQRLEYWDKGKLTQTDTCIPVIKTKSPDYYALVQKTYIHRSNLNCAIDMADSIYGWIHKTKDTMYLICLDAIYSNSDGAFSESLDGLTEPLLNNDYQVFIPYLIHHPHSNMVSAVNFRYPYNDEQVKTVDLSNADKALYQNIKQHVIFMHLKPEELNVLRKLLPQFGF